MPIVRLETNSRIPEEKNGTLTQRLGTAIAAVTGHSLAEMRVELAGDRKMRMADSDEPIAHIEVKGVELSKDRAGELTAAICPILDNVLGIRDNKVYIAVITTRNSMWRVNGDMQ